MQAKWLTNLKQLINNDEIEKFYWTYAWKKLRKQRRELDNQECQRCKRKGRYSPAEVVHHIQRVDKAPHLALTITNVESLCSACHNAVHPEKLGGYTESYDNQEMW